MGDARSLGCTAITAMVNVSVSCSWMSAHSIVYSITHESVWKNGS